MKDGGAQHWESMAALWAQLGSPLRPSAEDQAGYRPFVFPWIERCAHARVVILGVTPELYHLGWQAHHEVIAVDRAPAMIAEVWPGAPERALESDWLCLPLPEDSRELAISDGGLIMLEYPAGHRALAQRLHRLLVAGGRCVFRLFVPPAERESVESVLADLRAARIANLNILKLRLGMALQASPREGVAVEEILRAVETVETDLARLAARLGWAFDHLRVIETYRDSPARYYFPSEAELRSIFCEQDQFAFIGRRNGTYPLAERCPIVAFERLPGGRL